MRLGSQVALEAVGIAALLVAHFAPETELLQALGFDAFAQVFERTFLGFGHLDGFTDGLYLYLDY